MTSLLIFSINLRANDNVVPIKKGEAAPFEGVLFTEDKANEVRRDLLELDKQRYMVESRNERLGILQSRIELKDEEIELFRVQNDRLVKHSKTTDVERMVWFALGVIATGAAVYGAGSLAR